VSFSNRKPVAVQVIDAETKQPIMAEARITDTFIQPAMKDYDPWAPSGKNGIVRLKAEPNGKHPVLIEAKAKGYQDDGIPLSDAALDKIESPGMFEDSDKRPAQFTIALYSGEPFKVQLVVPVGYRGIVKAELELKDNIPLPLGQRLFRCEVAASGVAQLIGPAVLRNISPERFCAVYKDGSPLDARMDGTKVGFRWLKHEGNFEWYVVGTQKDYDNFRQQFVPELETPRSEPTSSKGSGGGGRGGRGGRGGGGGGGGMGGGGMGSGGFQ